MVSEIYGMAKMASSDVDDGLCDRHPRMRRDCGDGLCFEIVVYPYQISGDDDVGEVEIRVQNLSPWIVCGALGSVVHPSHALDGGDGVAQIRPLYLCAIDVLCVFEIVFHHRILHDVIFDVRIVLWTLNVRIHLRHLSILSVDVSVALFRVIGLVFGQDCDFDPVLFSLSNPPRDSDYSASNPLCSCASSLHLVF
jgi:hypothetical protein